MDLLYKTDLDATLDRFDAWWRRAPMDRPVVTITARRGDPPSPPASRHETLAERWLDASYQIAAAESVFRSTRYLGESLPVFTPNLGPDQLATVFGATLEFGESTSWSHPVAQDIASVAALAPSFAHPAWEWLERATDLSLGLGRGKWLTGYADLHMNGDLVAALRGPQDLCIDCIEDPEGVRAACEHVTPVAIEAYARLAGKLLAQGLPTATWLEAPLRGKMHVPSCDFNALIGASMFEDLFLPSIVEECRAADRSIFHLDGPTALQHLDSILAVEEIDAVQWVYGAGNGPAARWVDVYRRIQDAGKALQVICEGIGDMLEVSRSLAVEGVWYSLGGPYPIDAAEGALRTMEK